MQNSPVVTERTAKNLKALLLIGVFTLLVGLLLLVADLMSEAVGKQGTGGGMFLTTTGLVLIGVAKFLAWWRHG